MKKAILITILAVLLTAFTAPPLDGDDKELFMGINVSVDSVKPNVVILADTSASMNNLLWYPKNGLDGMSGTADDGFNPRQEYEGTFDTGTTNPSNVVEKYPEFTEPWNNASHWEAVSQTTQWYGRWREGTHAKNYHWNELGRNYTHCYEGDGSGTRFRTGTNGANYFQVGDRIIWHDTIAPFTYAAATISSKSTDINGHNWFELTDIVGGPIVPSSNEDGWFERNPGYTPVVVRLYSEYDDPDGTNITTTPTRLDKNYLNWIFLYASPEQVAAVSHHSKYGTFDVTDTSLFGAWSICDKDNYKKPMKRFTRIQITREVLCHVARNSNTNVMLGLYIFNPNKEPGDTVDDKANGGYRMDGLGDRSDEVSLIAFMNNIWGILGTSNTPLAEALADVWYYYKPGPASKTYWPVDVELANGTISVSNSVSDIDWWCQNNYVVVMTDGESTQDNFANSKFDGSIFTSPGTSPVKRSANWNSWADGWGDLDNNESNIYYEGIPAGYNSASALYCPNWSCWLAGSNGTDYLDDVAYFLRHQDMFPDDYFGDDPIDGWPGPQAIFTYVIGFNQDNDMLLETALNGDGAYYTANNYDELVAAFESVITSILLRNFAFSAITAPKKTTSISADGVSYVGYFMPSQAAPVWEGHLLANKLIEKWGFDANDDGEFASDELFNSETLCQTNNPGETCQRILNLSNTEEWDAATKLAEMDGDRSLFTHSGATRIAFTEANKATLQPMFGATVTEAQAGSIISEVSKKQFGDVFHSDIGFVGPPLMGKSYLQNQNPTECSGDPTTDADCFGYFATQNASRVPMIYVGTNDGILHKIKAENGAEQWGLIPDEVMPTLKTIAVDKQHEYTVDGRLLAEDIYYVNGNTKEWKTMLYFGLRRGGNAFYALDITDSGADPKVMWKFKDATYSGGSWAKPVVGQIRYQDGEDIVQRWVAVLAGGYAPNAEVSSDSKGKSLFVVDASTGDLLWMIGYNSTDGAEDDEGTDHLDLTEVGDNHYLTKSDLFDFAVPSALTAVDTTNDGVLDTAFFGNVGGHLFRLDMSNLDRSEWTVTPVYTHNVTDLVTGTISAIAEGNILTLGKDAASFVPGYQVTGQTSGAMGFVTEVDGAKKTVTVSVESGVFQVDEVVKTRDYAPIYLQPAVAYDQCYQLWVTFGTGDRDRPRTNPAGGRYIAIQGQNKNGLTLSDLQSLSLSGTDDTELAETTLDLTNYNGWYLNFPGTSDKLFDPEPLILPDTDGVPHLYFNTYTPPSDTAVASSVDNPCAAPSEGDMMLYDIALYCGPNKVAGGREEGRIAGGGIYQGTEFVQYLGSGAVGSVPPLDRVEDKRLPYPGGVIFIKERKR